MSAAASVDADGYDWTIDGVPFGTDEVFAIDLETRGLVSVELVVTNGGGSDSDSQYLFTTTVSNDTVADDVILAGVIAGAMGCDSLSVISTVGGCFNAGGADLEHIVERSRAGAQNVSVMVYDPVADSVVTPGFSAAVIWERPSGVFSSCPAGVPQTDYGPAPRVYRNVVGPLQPHITSYYPIATGDTLTFDIGHGAFLGDPSMTPLDDLTLDCSSGSLQVSSNPVN